MLISNFPSAGPLILSKAASKLLTYIIPDLSLTLKSHLAVVGFVKGCKLHATGNIEISYRTHLLHFHLCQFSPSRPLPESCNPPVLQIPVVLHQTLMVSRANILSGLVMMRITPLTSMILPIFAPFQLMTLFSLRLLPRRYPYAH